MRLDDRITTIALQEFRLRAADTGGEAARLAAILSAGLEGAVPLLTSIDDERDVATVRALHAGEEPNEDPGLREELARLVTSWQPIKHYAPRITEHSESPPSSYRLAVTESGINNAGPDPLAAGPRGSSVHGSSAPLGLLWIGVPVGTHAGLLILLGSDGHEDPLRSDPHDWPLPLSRYLGVRIYERRSVVHFGPCRLPVARHTRPSLLSAQ